MGREPRIATRKHHLEPLVGQKQQGKTRSMFQGKIVELKNAVYNVGIDKDTFAKTTQEVAEYVTSQYNDAAEFRIGMEKLELTQLAKPMLPGANAMSVKMKLWQLAQRTYKKKVKARNRNGGCAYAIVLRQCSRALQN
jgi:hypothetical protein